MKRFYFAIRRSLPQFDGGKLNVPVCDYCIILNVEESRCAINEHVLKGVGPSCVVEKVGVDVIMGFLPSPGC